MTEVIDIWNMALLSIGAQATIADIAEDSKEANTCRTFYTNLRTSLLRAAPWGFARRQVSLTLLGNLEDETSPYPWLYKYAYPTDCMCLRYLIPPPMIQNEQVVVPTGAILGVPGWMPSRANRFIIANDYLAPDPEAEPPVEGYNRKVVLTQVVEAIGVYTADIEDPDLWDNLFVDAMVNALGATIVYPITGNVGMMAQWRDQAFQSIMQARASDGNEAMPTADHTVDWIRVRGVPTAYTGPLDGPGLWYQGWDYGGFNGWGM